MITLASSLRMGSGSGGGGDPTEYIDGVSDSGTNGVSTTLLSGTQSGDVYIVAFGDDSRVTGFSNLITPSGWGGMTDNWPRENGRNSIDHIIGYGTTTGTISAPNSRIVDAVGLVAFRNMGTPPSLPSVSDIGSGSISQLPSMTVTEAGSTSVIVAFLDDDSSTIETIPSGYTLAVQDGRGGGSLAIMYKLDLPVGSTGTTSLEWNNSDAHLTNGYIIPPL